MKDKILIIRNNLDHWLSGAGNNGERLFPAQLAKQENIDDGNFSKMYNGELSCSTSVMKKLCRRTGYTLGALFEYIPENGNINRNQK